MSMRALVISGGGSKGAFAGGVAEYLINSCKYEYDLFLGVSTGSLMIPFLALGQMEKLKHLYTHVSQKDIFSTCPVKVKKQPDGSFKTGIHHWNIIKMFLRGRKTFGESFHLRELIAHHLTAKDFEQLHALDKEVIVTVSNLSQQQIEYYCQHDDDYEGFCDWMWMSANLVPFMSLAEKNGKQYADGGLGIHIPIQEAINRGVTEIDAIVLRPQTLDVQQSPPGNAFSLIFQAFDFALNQISYNDVSLAKCRGKLNDVQIRVYYTPAPLTDNPLIFDPETMKRWWQEGYAHAEKTNPFCKWVLASEA